ncbi:hypothetical protein BLOT_001125 [Blomia tropicalis]|nr:hypothetical protein BLOT_001125 [Blomia tropicalis]
MSFYQLNIDILTSFPNQIKSTSICSHQKSQTLIRWNRSIIDNTCFITYGQMLAVGLFHIQLIEQIDHKRKIHNTRKMGSEYSSNWPQSFICFRLQHPGCCNVVK